MKVKLNVKDGSVIAFLKDKLLNPTSSSNRGCDDEVNPYSAMKDEMLFKKDCGLNPGEILKIELFDKARMSGKELVNTYIYKAESYDDVAIKMVLDDFKVVGKSE